MTFDPDTLYARLMVVVGVLIGIVQWSWFLNLSVTEAEVVKVLRRGSGKGAMSSPIVRYDVPGQGQMQSLYVARSSSSVGDRIQVRYERANPQQPLDDRPGYWQLGPVVLVMVGMFVIVFTTRD